MFVSVTCDIHNEIGWQNRVKSVSDSTEPVNYTGSYTGVRKRRIEIEIVMHQSAGKVIIDTITIAPRTIVTTAIQRVSLFLNVTVFQEQEGGSRN